MHLYRRQVVVEYIGSGKGWDGDEAPEFVLLCGSQELDVDPPPEILYGLPEDRVVHQFEQVLLELAGGLFS